MCAGEGTVALTTCLIYSVIYARQGHTPRCHSSFSDSLRPNAATTAINTAAACPNNKPGGTSTGVRPHLRIRWLPAVHDPRVSMHHPHEPSVRGLLLGNAKGPVMGGVQAVQRGSATRAS